MKKKIFLAIIAIVGFVSITRIAFAKDNPVGSEYILAKDQVIKQNLFKAKEKITIDGEVNGDVYLVGKDITINGKVNGNIFLAGERINLTSQAIIKNSTFLAGKEVINSSTGSGSNYILAGNLETGNLFSTAGSLLSFSSNGIINGNILGDFMGIGEKLKLEATVAQSTKLDFQDIKITKNAKLLNLEYRSNNNDVIEDNKSILGNLQKLEAKYKKTEAEQRIERLRSILQNTLGKILFCLFLYKLFKDRFINLSKRVLLKPLQYTGIGALACLTTPLIFGLLLLFGVIIGFKFFAVSAVSFIIILLLSKSVVVLVLANKLALKLSKNNFSLLMLAASLLILFLVEALLSVVPGLYILVNLILILWGVGALTSILLGRLKSTTT